MNENHAVKLFEDKKIRENRRETNMKEKQQTSIPKENSHFLCKDETGNTSINIRFAEEDIRITQTQLAEKYQTAQQNISLHINNIYKENELPKEATYKEFLLVRTERNQTNMNEVIPWKE